MDFIDEQNIAFAQIGQKACEITCPFNGWPTGNTDLRPHFVGNDRRHCGFTQTRRAIQQHVVNWLAAFFSSVDCQFQVLLQPFLANVIGKIPRPKRLLELLIVSIFIFNSSIHNTVNHVFTLNANFTRWSVGNSPSTFCSACAASVMVKPRATNASTASSFSSTLTPCSNPVDSKSTPANPTLSFSSTTMRSATRLPTPGAV